MFWPPPPQPPVVRVVPGNEDLTPLGATPAERKPLSAKPRMCPTGAGEASETPESRWRMLIQVPRKIPACLLCEAAWRKGNYQEGAPTLLSQSGTVRPFNTLSTYPFNTLLAKGLSPTRPPNRSASVLFAVSRDIKSREALNLDLDNRLDGCRVPVAGELAEDIGSEQHNIEVVARKDVLDVPEDLVVVFLV